MRVTYCALRHRRGSCDRGQSAAFEPYFSGHCFGRAFENQLCFSAGLGKVYRCVAAPVRSSAT